MLKSQSWSWSKAKLHFIRQATLLSTATAANMAHSGDSGSSVGHSNFQDVFSLKNKQRTIEDLSTLKAKYKIENFVGEAMKRKAAVLIPLCYDINNRPAILYNLRSRTMTKHRGEISFPGGAVDPEDNDDHVVTALRETHEELGISKDKIEIWTTLLFVPTVTSLIRVAPVLGFIKEPVDPTKLNISPCEVEFAFTVPLEHLCNPDNWEVTQYTRHSNKYSMPAFKNLAEYMGGEKEAVSLWGLTAIITHVVLQSLVPQIYQRNISFNGRFSKSRDKKPESKM